MRRRVVIGFSTLVALCLLLPTATVWYATHTEAGLQTVIKLLSRKLGPVQMWIDGASGTFAGGFRVEHFKLLHERVEVRADGISGRVSVLPLLWVTIKSSKPHIEHAWVHVLPHAPSGEPLTKFMPPLLSIVTEAARIDSATLIVPNGKRFDGTALIASGALRAHTMRFHDVAFHMGDIAGTAGGILAATEPMKLSGESRWTWASPGQPPWLVTADFNGDLASLALHGEFMQPFQASFTGALEGLTHDWHWHGDAVVDDLDLRAWGGGNALGRISGSLALHGNRDGFAAQGPIQAQGLHAGVFDTEFAGNYADRVLNARRIELVHRETHATVTASGTIGIVSGGPELGLRGNWQKFQWPLRSAAPAVRSASGEFSLAGRWPFELQANARITPAGLPEFPLQLRGSLAKEHLLVRDASAALWGGTAKLTGDVQWAPQTHWAIAGHVADLNTAQLRNDLPGRLNFDAKASGNRFGADTDLDVELRNLTGKLRGTAARGSGAVQRTAGVWKFDALQLTAGGLNLAVDGSLGTAADIDFRVDATDLGIIGTQTHGTIHAKGSFKGSLQNPTLLLVGSGRKIQYEGISLRSVDADINLDTRPGKDLHADIKLRDLGSRDRLLNQLDLSLTGTADANKITLAMQAVKVRLNATASGGFANGSWRGRWQDLTIADDAEINLKLDTATALQLAADNGTVERFCLTGSPGRLCGLASWNPQAWSIDADASEIPMSALTAGLTPKVSYEGRLGVQAHVFANSGTPVQGSLHAELTGAQLRRERSNSRQDVIRLGSGTVDISANLAALRASLKLDAQDRGSISGDLTAQRAGYAVRDMPLRASLKASTRELDFINIYVPEVDRAAGKLLVDVALGGTLGQPTFGGVLQLADGELDLYPINLQLRKAAFQARVNDNRVDFSGSAQAADGKLDARGNLSWKDGNPQGAMQLTGNNLLMVNVPEARITASPDLKFSIKGHQIDVTGTVTIPSARLLPADLTGAVLSSSDEIIKGSQPVNPADRFLLSSTIHMVLGEHVNIDTFGLSGRITGELTVQTTPDGVSRGTGELNIADGKYAALGRRLDVQRGRLIFGGGLLGDPGVDLRAIKQFPDVVAGVNVRGTLRQPRMTFFSEPSLPQAQIVSLILAGGSLDSAQNGNGNGTARGELLAQGGAILAQQLGQRIGVDDVSIEQDLTNETSLVLGKFLSPRLYVSYGISLTEAINTIKMRYTLGDHWTIKTESGKERSADLVYTIEK